MDPGLRYTFYASYSASTMRLPRRAWMGLFCADSSAGSSLHRLKPQTGGSRDLELAEKRGLACSVLGRGEDEGRGTMTAAA
jgi:hypothetical protein